MGLHGCMSWRIKGGFVLFFLPADPAKWGFSPGSFSVSGYFLTYTYAYEMHEERGSSRSDQGPAPLQPGDYGYRPPVDPMIKLKKLHADKKKLLESMRSLR